MEEAFKSRNILQGPGSRLDADTLQGKRPVYFAKALDTTIESYIEGVEIADPSAPATNSGRLYFRDNGAGKTQLVCRFASGAVQVICTEP